MSMQTTPESEHAGLDYWAPWVPPTKLSSAPKKTTMPSFLEVPQKLQDLPSRESTCDEYIDDWPEAPSTDPCTPEETSGDEASCFRVPLPPGLQPSVPMVKFSGSVTPPPGLDGNGWHQGGQCQRSTPTRQSFPWLAQTEVNSKAHQSKAVQGPLARAALRERGEQVRQEMARAMEPVRPANEVHRRTAGRRKNASNAKAAKQQMGSSIAERQNVRVPGPMKVHISGLSF